VRLFAAVELSRQTRDAMAVEQHRIAASLGSAGVSLKWVNPENAHLTLVFLGHVESARVPAIVETVRQDVDATPFHIVFSGTGVFPLRGSPRVLWAGVGAGIDRLGALQRGLAARIAAQGVTLEGREFHPHLTLGRWTSSRASDRARALAVQSGTIAHQRVARVTLYESRLSAAGAAYSALAHANLIRR
jgi:2'-5' RNA ligase